MSERTSLAAAAVVGAAVSAALARAWRRSCWQRESALCDVAALSTELEERRRVDGDLHDRVIQRVFAAGLQIQGVVPKLPEELRPQVAAAMQELDGSIHALRAAVGHASRA